MRKMQVQSLCWEDPLKKGNGNPLQYSCLENPNPGVTEDSDMTGQPNNNKVNLQRKHPGKILPAQAEGVREGSREKSYPTEKCSHCQMWPSTGMGNKALVLFFSYSFPLAKLNQKLEGLDSRIYRGQPPIKNKANRMKNGKWIWRRK